MCSLRSSSCQPAMDHILANSDSPVPEASEQGAGGAANEVDEDEDDEGLKAHIAKLGGDEGMVAKVSFSHQRRMPRSHQSIKCSECGKIFRSTATASFHGEKSGHQEFEESTEEVS